jgi:Glucose / Sorbosone dehydrogenase
MFRFLLIAALLLMHAPVDGQSTNDPFPTPIPAADGVIVVKFRPFAAVPDMEGTAARTMTLVNEPGTRRLFVNDMRGPIYSVSYDGRRVQPYVDVDAPQWAVVVQSSGRERGVQSIAFHPQFNERDSRGFGKFYTLTDTANTKPTPDFRPRGGTRTHDTILLEWSAKTPTADAYDGGPPRELMRVEQPFANHNGGLLAFNSTARPGTADFGLLYMSFADGGSGGDPFNMAQNLGSLFGKLLRIDPFGTDGANGKYGIPSGNPFVADANPDTLGEIYAYGLRNPQRFTWDAKNGNLFLADIGQNIVEEVDLVTAGANLGWNAWEGSYKFLSREGVDRASPRSDPSVAYPIVEYGQLDPLLQPQSAVTMGTVYRQTAIKQLTNRLVFGDIPSGEIFYVSADDLPKGGQEPLRRILLTDGGTPKTLLELIREENAKQSRPPATRADLRFGSGPDGQIFLLNKADGVIRVLIPDGQ